MCERTRSSTLSLLAVAGLLFSLQTATAESDRADAADRQRSALHWAFQKPVEPALPPINNSLWPRSPIDVFVLRRLEESGLAPSPVADRHLLIRRTTFSLTGLPPTTEEIAAFVADQAPGAYARVVDRLLASPHYGEHWGRHWLDVARYADSNGLDENAAHANAWRYRDYVIRAFNEDKPYDAFVQEQLAGDLLPADEPSALNEQLIATGFLSLGPKVLAEVDKTKMEMDIIDEQMDTLGKALLGLSFGCARCHDHPFDPISVEDYYALAGIFKSTQTIETFKTIARWHENKLFDRAYLNDMKTFEVELAVRRAAVENLLADATAALQKQLGAGAALPAEPEESFSPETRAELKRRREAVSSFEQTEPQPPRAMGVQDGQATDLSIHIRGDHLTLGEKVPRGIPKFLARRGYPPIEDKASGRLELARDLSSLENPLLARVIVNRVWRWHFGRGLVASTENFGTTGDRPTHPQLLDWLAVKFMQDGWSIKRLHRLIMLSAVYQMASDYDATSFAVDPENRLLWRARIRRLTAEELRDAMLAVSGRLDATTGGPSIETENFALIFDHTSKDTTTYHDACRSVYLPVIRNHLHDSFTLFDYNGASVPNGNRSTTTVASQALYLMNSGFVREASGRLANRALALDFQSDRQRVDWLYRLTAGRPATEFEVSQAIGHLRRYQQLVDQKRNKQSRRDAWHSLCQAFLMSNEFVYVR